MLAVLLPALVSSDASREALRQVLRGVAQHVRATVYLVDDGSVPALAPRDLEPLPPGLRVVLARHGTNLGQGAALETARQLALRAGGFEACVTMDADDQHDPTDLARLVAALDAGADVALGDRFAGGSVVPRGRAILLRAAALFEGALTGVALGDAHNGLRAFTPAALAAIPIRQNRMAHATEIRARVAAAGLRVVSVPVTVRYPATRREGSQPSLGAFTILRDLLVRYLFGAPR